MAVSEFILHRMDLIPSADSPCLRKPVLDGQSRVPMYR